MCMGIGRGYEMVEGVQIDGLVWGFGGLECVRAQEFRTAEVCNLKLCTLNTECTSVVRM